MMKSHYQDVDVIAFFDTIEFTDLWNRVMLA
jgi:hypothetical protein